MMRSDPQEIPLIHLTETDSSNNYLNKLCREKEVQEFTTAYTDYQTAGKGQRGNYWESERQKNLLFSTVLYPVFLETSKQFLLSQIIALSVKEELDTLSNGFSIKWPNDIYWKEKKISGILIENEIIGHTLQKSIIGVGININQKTFHSPSPNPVSLNRITGKEYYIPHILNGIIERLVHYYTLLKQNRTEEINNRYHQSLFRKSGKHQYRDHTGEFTAYILYVKPEGILVLEDETGNKKEYAFKEVQYIL